MILAVSLALHAVVVCLILTARIDIRVIDFGHEKRNVMLVPPSKIKFTATPPGGNVVPPSGQTAIPSGPAGSPSATRAEGQPAGGGGAVSGTGPGSAVGGTRGTLLTPSEKDRERELLSGFSLVYPADAMLNLSKYAEVPEDEWLRPFRRSLRPAPDLSRYTRPLSDPRSTALGGTGSGGGGVIPGGIGTIKPPPAGVVAAFVPEDVKTFDLSGWATEVLNAVQRNWSLGTSPGTADWSGRVTITVLVLKSGELAGIDFASLSGLDPLDTAAMKAVDGSGPWPALPEGFPGTSLELQLVFKYGK